MTLQRKLEKIEASYKQQTHHDVDSALVRVTRMIILAYRPQTAKPYQPKEEDKITHEEWRLDCEKDLRYERLHFGEQSIASRKQIFADWEAFVTEIGGWKD